MMTQRPSATTGQAAPFTLLLVGATALSALMVLAGCHKPLNRGMEQTLREQTIAQQRAYEQAVRHAEDVLITRQPSQVTRNMDPERLQELEAASGLEANARIDPDLGMLLTGESQVDAVAMTLERVMQLMLEKNLDLKIARLVPALRETQITQAEAVFDAVFFANFSFSKLDTPQPPTASTLATFGTVQQETVELTTGIRKLISTGGQITASTSVGRNERTPSFFGRSRVIDPGPPPITVIDPINHYYDTDIALTIQQPLLRNFGADITRSQIMLARSSKDQALADLQQSVMDRMVETEQAYWTLVFARERLLSAQRVVQRNQRNYEIVFGRTEFDATSLQVSQVGRSLDERRLDMIDARRDYYLASDQLKQLMNDPSLPVAGETVIVPLDRMVDVPLQFNLASAIQTALRHRPDVKRSLSEIGDATIRLRVADNQRLPVLDLTATARWQGISTANVGEAYDNTLEGDFIDYIIGVEGQVPLGNRGPNALWRQRKIERNASVQAYQRTVQNGVAEVKAAMRILQSGYQAMEMSHAARIAAAEVVRGLQVQMDAGAELSPAFVNTVIQGDEDLFRTEIRQAQVLADYNVAVVQYYRAIGKLMEHNAVDFDAEAGRRQ